MRILRSDLEEIFLIVKVLRTLILFFKILMQHDENDEKKFLYASKTAIYLRCQQCVLYGVISQVYNSQTLSYPVLSLHVCNNHAYGRNLS